MNSKIIIFGLLAMLFLSSVSFAETTCKAEDCGITITIKIAFAFQNVQNENQYMQDVEDEIEQVWNNGDPTYGDCKCPVTFEVETQKVNDCVNNPPAGYHCVTVTSYNNNPPRNQTNWTGGDMLPALKDGASS